MEIGKRRRNEKGKGEKRKERKKGKGGMEGKEI